MTSGITVMSTRTTLVSTTHATVATPTTSTAHASHRYWRRTRPVERRKRSRSDTSAMTLRPKITGQITAAVDTETDASAGRPYGFGTSTPYGAAGTVTLTAGPNSSTAASGTNAHASTIDGIRQASRGRCPDGNVSESPVNPANTNTQPVALAQALNAPRESAPLSVSSETDAVTRTLPRNRPAAIRSSSHAIRWPGRRMARITPGTPYARTRSKPAGSLRATVAPRSTAPTASGSTMATRGLPWLRAAGTRSVVTGVPTVAWLRGRHDDRTFRAHRRRAASTTSTGRSNGWASCTGSSGRPGETGAAANRRCPS